MQGRGIKREREAQAVSGVRRVQPRPDPNTTTFLNPPATLEQALRAYRAETHAALLHQQAYIERLTARLLDVERRLVWQEYMMMVCYQQYYEALYSPPAPAPLRMQTSSGSSGLPPVVPLPVTPVAQSSGQDPLASLLFGNEPG